MNRMMRVCSWGAVNPAGFTDEVVTMIEPGSSASPARAFSMIAPTSCISVETLTSTRGRGSSANSAEPSPGGRHARG